MRAGSERSLERKESEGKDTNEKEVKIICSHMK